MKSGVTFGGKGDRVSFPKYEFGEFELDVRQRRLSRRGDSEPLAITARVFDALLYLVEHRDRLIEKSELLAAVWPKVVVEENNLATTISTLRRLLGERPHEHRYIVTVSGRGYRFVADVTAPDGTGAAGVGPRTDTARLTPLAAVAVLPFENQTADRSLDRPGADLVRSLNRLLSEAPNLAVVAQRSADAYASARADVRAIAAALGATHLIEIAGSGAGDELKITAQLIDGVAGYQVWSREFRRARDAFLKNRDDVMLAVASVVDRNAGSTVFDDREPYTLDVEAHVEWLRGLKLANQLTERGFNGAITHFENATRRDPKFSLAWATLAATQAQMMSFGYEHPDSAVRFREAAEHARAIRPDSRVARFSCATVAAARGQWEDAEEHFLALDSSDDASPTAAINVHLQAGRLRAAEHALRRLHSAAPGDPLESLGLAIVCGIAGKFQESQAFADEAVRGGIPDDILLMKVVRANSAERAGRLSDAADSMMTALSPPWRSAGGDEAVHRYYEALGAAAARPEALVALKRLEPHLSHDRYDTYLLRTLLIYWYARLEALDDAYRLADDWLAQFRKNDLVGVPHLSPLWSPHLREFRRDPRFARFAAGLNLVDFWKQRGPPDGCRLDGDHLRCS